MTMCRQLTGCDCGRLTCFISSLMSSLAGSNSSRMRSQRAANHPQTSMKSYVRCMWREQFLEACFEILIRRLDNSFE